VRLVEWQATSDRISRRLLSKAWWFLGWFFLQGLFMYLELFAEWFAVCLIGVLAASAYIAVFSGNLGQRLFRKLRAPRHTDTVVFSISFAIVLACWWPIRDNAYRSGKFGEPPDNRYITIHSHEANVGLSL
jgi:hypothetical protein